MTTQNAERNDWGEQERGPRYRRLKNDNAMGMHSNTIYKDLFFFWVAFRHTKNTCLDSLKANEVCAAEVQGFKVQKKQTIRKKTFL